MRPTLTGLRPDPCPPSDGERSLHATFTASYRVDAVPGLFDHGNDTLIEMLGPARRLVVACDSTAAVRRDLLVSYLENAQSRGLLEDLIVVDIGDDHEPDTDGMDACDALVDAAVKVQLGRRDAFLAFGGERIGQIVAVTAASFRRHTTAVRIHRDLAAVVASLRDGVRVRMAGGPISALQRQAHVIVDEDGLAEVPLGPAEPAALLALALLDRSLLDRLLTCAPQEWRAEGLAAVLRLCRRPGPGSPAWQVGEAWSGFAPKELDAGRRRVWSILLAARVAERMRLLPADTRLKLTALARRLEPDLPAARAVTEGMAETAADAAAVRRWRAGHEGGRGVLAVALPTAHGVELVEADVTVLETALAATPEDALARPHADVTVLSSERIVPTALRAQARTTVSAGFSVGFTERVLDPGSAALADLLPTGGHVLALVDPYRPDQLRRVRRLMAGYQREGYVARFTILPVTPTDRAKTLDQVTRIVHAAEGLGLGEHDRIIVVGGGTVMDIAGYAAYLYRGDTPYIRVPTTLVGMIDAGIGLKVGVNVNNQKNLMGAYHPPLACVCDPEFLRTLSQDELRCGLAEAVKIAAVCDAGLFDLIQDHHPDVLASRDTTAVREILDRSIRAMLQQLQANPFEDDLRRLPDFGHEFGHVLESLSRYRLRHGEAVAIGMALSCCLAVHTGHLSRTDLDRLLTLLRATGLALYDPVCDPDVLWRKLHDDVIPHKAGRLHLVVPRQIGVGGFIDSIEELDVRMLHEACAELRAWTRKDHDEPDQ
ncbi:3-dehydroquinate synthase family protein [Actinoallomurus soli]|uniref:3-dehydroquinate synthase family protein n=1 Tax=Actinoallomurus soli TaxID=2952535 RepID=UPI002093268A|nr:iron-containing alcohol dehydrogenase [Actinoallomurus soli]MCO5972481.1 iron-containing alcohol dehydrogenase [Actinoallomurus soli]